MAERSDSDGLSTAEDFYRAGGIDSRPDDRTVRVVAEFKAVDAESGWRLLDELLERDEVLELVCSVTEEAAP